MHNLSLNTIAGAVSAAIATSETDAKISERERGRGRQARFEGKSRMDCPWNGGVCEKWWLEGYDGSVFGAVAQ